MSSLQSSSVYPLTNSLAHKYEEIDVETEKMMDKAEDNCRKLYTGNISWSPSYTRIYLVLLYWEMRKDHYNGTHGNSKKLIVLQQKLNINYDFSLFEDDIIVQIHDYYARRTTVKIMVDMISLEYRAQLAMAKEEVGEMKVAVYLR